MNNSQIATAITLRDLNCESLETIKDRILLQKKVFLAQDIGLPLGYGYSWYIHGPYSTDLTAVAYQIIPEGFDSIDGNSFKEPYKKMIDRVNGLEAEIKEKEIQISIVQWYELIASIAYWHKLGFNTEDKILKQITKTKPQFSNELIQKAFESYSAFKETV